MPLSPGGELRVYARPRGRKVVLRTAARSFRALTAGALLAIAAGLALHAAGQDAAADVLWAATVTAMLLPLAWSVARELRHGRPGVDLIALVAMAGCLALGEYLAGAVVALMLAGGNALEAAAGDRAQRELTALLRRAPTTARRRRGDEIEEVAIDAIVAGDEVVVRGGEVVPVDGIVTSERAVLDEATLTGEALPATYAHGARVRSGTVNAGAPFDLRAARPAAESSYAALVRLVESARRERAPFVRVADRYALLLLPVTLVIAGAAWALSGDPVRGLAVVVVATPCPLILAAPIALVAGISRAAARGIIVKSAAVIERLARVRSVLLDKTGTLTLGTPQIHDVVITDGVGGDELIQLAASVDQLSAHVLADALVQQARARGLELDFPAHVTEAPGEGIEGDVHGRHVLVGSAGWLRQHGVAAAPDRNNDGLARIAVAVDGRPAGTIVMADHLRPDARDLVDELRGLGVAHVALASGDSPEVALPIGASVGVDRVYARQTPEDKVALVRTLRGQPELAPVMMVGDGINDAPALALADIGIAMGTTAATASSETADAVVTVEQIGRVAEAVSIGRRSLAIATQSVVVGMALSFLAMAFAATGHLPPVAGALTQEAIDVAVILNALRALRG